MDMQIKQGSDSEVIQISGDGLLELSRTNFYPGGGGQPCDTGRIFNDRFSADVVDVYREKGKILHTLSNIRGTIKKGDTVKQEINLDRRNKLMKMHTGEHILFKSLERVLKDITLTKIDLGVKESSLFVEVKHLDWPLLFKAEQLANSIIREDKRILERHITKEEAEQDGSLRIKVDRIPGDQIRVIEVEGFDKSACTGTHLVSTGQVKNILITGYSQTKRGYEIRFVADSLEELFEHSRALRQVAQQLKSDISHIPGYLSGLMTERDNYKERFRQLSVKMLDNYHSRKIGRLILVYQIVEDLEQKQLVQKASRLAVDNTLVCFISILSEKAILVVMKSKDLELDIHAIMKSLIVKLGGSGGGRDEVFSGSVPKEKSEELLSSLVASLDI